MDNASGHALTPVTNPCFAADSSESIPQAAAGQSTRLPGTYDLIDCDAPVRN